MQQVLYLLLQEAKVLYILYYLFKSPFPMAYILVAVTHLREQRQADITLWFLLSESWVFFIFWSFFFTLFIGLLSHFAKHFLGWHVYSSAEMLIRTTHWFCAQKKQFSQAWGPRKIMQDRAPRGLSGGRLRTKAQVSLKQIYHRQVLRKAVPDAVFTKEHTER